MAFLLFLLVLLTGLDCQPQKMVNNEYGYRNMNVCDFIENLSQSQCKRVKEVLKLKNCVERIALFVFEYL